MRIGCMLPSSLAAPDHIRHAEQLGFPWAFVFDSPAIYADPWVTLALAAERTERIHLGVAVITPRLRHPLASATALTHLCGLAPGRMEVVVGSGFTSQALLGEKPVLWSEVEACIEALRALLAGELVEWQGSLIGLLHTSPTGLTPPGRMPIWVAANGPKGCAVGDHVADRVLLASLRARPSRVPWALTYHGTVLDESEDFSTERVRQAAGPAAAFQLHLGQNGRLAGTAEAERFAERMARVSDERRTLTTHRGHLIQVQDDEWDLITPEVIRRGTASGTRAEMRARLEELDGMGCDAIMWEPNGPDISRELEAFADMARPWLAGSGAVLAQGG
jgi:5,10-methylenetetrahydromethanopterin reductase